MASCASYSPFSFLRLILSFSPSEFSSRHFIISDVEESEESPRGGEKFSHHLRSIEKKYLWHFLSHSEERIFPFSVDFSPLSLA
jgi:hypothetical protein